VIYWPDGSLRQDAFLGGALQLWQPQKGYRAGIVPVLLAASVRAQEGDSILDLGCGAGAAALCLGSRVPGLRLTGLEVQPEMAELARRNGEEAGLDFDVYGGDVSAPPSALREQSFDHVISNPPYYDRGRGSSAPDTTRETALGEVVAIEQWVKLAAKRLKPKGFLTMIAKADRLEDILPAARNRLGSLEVLPLAARSEQAAELALFRGRKDGRAALVLHAPVVLHQGDTHPGDKEHYTPQISDILRRGAALSF